MTERKVVICCGFGSNRIERSPLSHPWMDSARQAFSREKANHSQTAPRCIPSSPCLQRDVFIYEQCQTLFWWKGTFYKTRYKKAVCVLLEDLSRGAPENTVPIRSHPRNGFISLPNESVGLELGREVTLLKGGAAAVGEAQPSPIPVPRKPQRDGGVATDSR